MSTNCKGSLSLAQESQASWKGHAQREVQRACGMRLFAVMLRVEMQSLLNHKKHKTTLHERGCNSGLTFSARGLSTKGHACGNSRRVPGPDGSYPIFGRVDLPSCLHGSRRRSGGAFALGWSSLGSGCV